MNESISNVRIATFRSHILPNFIKLDLNLGSNPKGHLASRRSPGSEPGASAPIHVVSELADLALGRDYSPFATR